MTITVRHEVHDQKLVDSLGAAVGRWHRGVGRNWLVIGCDIAIEDVWNENERHFFGGGRSDSGLLVRTCLTKEEIASGVGEIEEGFFFLRVMKTEKLRMQGKSARFADER